MTESRAGRSLARPAFWGEGLTTGTNSFALPAGTVTFLLTDVEGSTRAGSRTPEAMAGAVDDHLRVLDRGDRAATAVCGRSSRARATAWWRRSARASDAVARGARGPARLCAHSRGRRDVELRVRIALHTGEAQLRDEGNYFGLALNRCARLRAIAHGGQTLLSRATHDLVRRRLPRGRRAAWTAACTACGTSVAPSTSSRSCIPDLPARRPPLRSLDALPNNLPDQLTSFVGRERELARAARGARARRGC